MDFRHFTAGKDDDGRRLDRIARKFLDGSALSSVYKFLRKGLIKVNGKKRSAEFKVSENDDIEIAEFLCQNGSGEKEKENEGKSGRLDGGTIIKRSGDILILNKPYDIPVQPSKDFKGRTLSELVEEDFRAKGGSKSIAFRTGPLHRLDRKTTGLIVFSQSLEGARIFTELMKEHRIKKTYIGIMEGRFEKEEEWTDRIEKSGIQEERGSFHKVSVTDSGNGSGKLSKTRAIPVFHGRLGQEEATVAAFVIETGRTHQIRAQSKAHGHPLLGDTAYGAKKISGCGRDFFLHAYSIEFSSEDSDELGKIGLEPKTTAKIPDDFKSMLQKIGLKENIENFLKIQ